MTTNQKTQHEDARNKSLLSRIGPGLITVCVVIGPGSVLTSSQTGADYGYSMSWVVVLAVLFMLVYMTLGAKFGAIVQQSPGNVIAQGVGRWLAILIGLSIFSVAAIFQYSNNLGAYAALELFFPPAISLIVLNCLALLFLFAFANVYQVLEKLMTVFVALMLICFSVNLFNAKPNWQEWLQGFLPSANTQIEWSILGLVGTTFIIASAYYQAYLVQQKNWKKEDLRSGLVDSRLATFLMAVITLMIMGTAATGLRGQSLSNVAEVAEQLKSTFGELSRTIFALGLFSAAYSSFLINSMIGGYTLADGLGLPCDGKAQAPRYFAALVLLIGLGVGLYVVTGTGNAPFQAIVTAQAITVFLSPLLAGTLLWVTNRKDLMGEHTNSLTVNVLAVIGLVLLLAMAAYTAIVKVLPNVIDF